MFKFGQIEFLYALGLIPFLIIIFIMMLKWRKKALAAFGERAVIVQLMPDVSDSKTRLKLVLQLLAFAFLVIAMAAPQTGAKLEEVKREGVDLMIALDVSNSMLAEDLSPNRIERAKQAISKLVDNLKGDRIGIIVFAGEAYVQMPVTTDYGAAKLFLNTINTDIVPTQGTAIGTAIQLAIKSLESEQKQKSRAIIVITDGENHEDDALKETENAVKQGIAVHTIGMGSPSGGPIPVYRDKRPVGYKTDKEGNTVVTKLNEAMLQQIAVAGNGVYVRATNAQGGLNIIMEEINKMEKQEFASKMYTDYEDQFQYFIALALLFLTLDFFISRRKSKWLSNINLFGEKN